LILTSIFLGGTIVLSRRQKDVGLWKTSSLAVMANGLDDAARRGFESQNLFDLVAKSRETDVLLIARKDMLRFGLV
jgi:hypothetical protein